MKTFDQIPCPRRQKMQMVDAGGVRTEVFRCIERTAPDFGNNVTVAVCNACPVRRLLVKANTPKADPPEEPIELKVQRNIRDEVSDGSPWVPCDDRRKLTIIKPCGQVNYTKVCNSAVCAYNQKDVTTDICKACPVRVVQGVAVLPLSGQKG